MGRSNFKRSNSFTSSEKNESDAESIIIELKEKMSRLKFRLLDCQNQNQMLRKELLHAKKVVNTEVSPTSKESFYDLLQQASSTDYQGRREKILLLRDKLNELQNQIKEMEDRNVDKLHEEVVKTDKSDRVEDKKICNKQMMDKELQYLLGNSCQLKRKLEVWKKRNAELCKEIELLRLELERLLEKSKEDKQVHESYYVVEKELRARQNEKIDMRNKLEAEKSRNKQLVDEISMIKDDLSALLSKINDDKLLTEALSNQQGYMHDLLERQQLLSENDNRQFRDDMSEIQAKHASNCNMLNHLQDVIEDKNILCRHLEDIFKQKVLIDDSQEKDEQASNVTVTSGSQSNVSQPSILTDDSSERDREEPSDAENELTEVRNLLEERDQYINVFRSMYEEITQLRNILLANDKRLNDWMSQLLQSRSLLAQKNAEINDLQESLKRLQDSKTAVKKFNGIPLYGSGFADEIKIKNDVLNKEYQYLMTLWELLSTKKENSIFVFTVSIDSITKLFADAMDDLILCDDQSNLDGEVPQEGPIVSEETETNTTGSEV